MNAIVNAKNLASSLIQRMAWESQCKPLLKSYNVAISLGAEATKLKLFAEFEKSELYAQKFAKNLYPHYLNLLYSGDCTLRIFKVESEKFKTIYDFISSVSPNESIATKFFPYQVEDDCLSDLNEDTELTYQAVHDGKLYAFFSTNRTITERTNIDPKFLNEGEEVTRFLKKYSSLTAFSDIPRQYIDIVCLNPADETIEVRLDTSSAVAFKDIDKLFFSLQGTLIDMLPDECKGGVFKNPVNFFPLINKLYVNNDCRVCELGFTSADGYVHSERDRNKTGNGDVRKGDFHVGGVDNCEITPYKISTRWKSGFTDELKYDYELSLNSTFRELSKIDGGFLDYAVISACPSVSDMEKILSLLKKNDELSKAC
ncbi:hypothetical protein M2G94_04515 [Vibrio vulnificus]|nr:hypothetical protein [Vibrio vulnificus]